MQKCNKKIINAKKKLPKTSTNFIQTDLEPSFTNRNTHIAITHLKNSKAMDTDKIYNIYLKHLGHNAISAITQVFNHSWLHSIIPAIWKQPHIIPIIKPNKALPQPSSYRPISLLCTLGKLLEKLICIRIKTHLPTSYIQHGFKKNHFNTTLPTNLSTHPRWFQPKSTALPL